MICFEFKSICCKFRSALSPARSDSTRPPPVPSEEIHPCYEPCMNIKASEASSAPLKGVECLDGDDFWVRIRCGWRRPLIITGMILSGAFSCGWLGEYKSSLPTDPRREELTAGAAIDAVVDQIILVESGGDPNAKN